MRSRDFSINRKTIVFSFITQFFQYCINALVLPFILAYVDSTTLGVWYIFLSVSGLAYLLDFGFSASLSRNLSYVFSGAKELLKEGYSIETEDKRIDYKLLYSVIYTTKYTYWRISVVMLFLLITIGTYYIIYTTNGTNYIYEWLFFSFSVVINYYYSYVNVFIRGRGKISLSNKLMIISRSTYVIVVGLLLFWGCNLWSLIIANFLSAFVSRQLGLFYFWDKELKSKIKSVSFSPPLNLFSIIWYNAQKTGITSVTVYAYSQSNVLIGGLFLSLSQVAQLGLSMQLFAIIQTLAGVCLNIFYPRICSLWVTNDKKQIKNLFLKSQLICYSIFFASCSMLLFGGNFILHLFHSQTALPSVSVLIIFVLFYFMENTHGKCAILISTTNTIPFYKADIVACTTTVMVMVVLLNCGLGLYSFPIAMCCGSLPYNSWKWPLVCYKLLKD